MRIEHPRLLAELIRGLRSQDRHLQVASGVGSCRARRCRQGALSIRKLL